MKISEKGTLTPLSALLQSDLIEQASINYLYRFQNCEVSRLYLLYCMVASRFMICKIHYLYYYSKLNYLQNV